MRIKFPVYFLLVAAGLVGQIAPSQASFYPAVRYPVQAIAQTKSNDCWAASAAMLMSWHYQTSVSEHDMIGAGGYQFARAFQQNSGLFESQFRQFADSLNMRTEATHNFAPDDYYNLFRKARGPVWVASASMAGGVIQRHVRVLTGVSGDGTPDGTILDIVDSDGGRHYRESVADFGRTIETRGGYSDFFAQFMYY